MFNWFYFLVAALLVLMLAISFKLFHGSGGAAVGIAESKEYEITVERSVFIKAVHVVHGMQVKKGDLLMELSSRDLEMNVEKVARRIALIKQERVEKTKLTGTKIDYINAQNDILLEDIEQKIKETASTLDLNASLVRQFISDTLSVMSPLQQRITSLREQQEKYSTAKTIRIKDATQESIIDQRTLENEIILLEQELTALADEQHRLNKYAIADGVVDNIFVKEGEQVQAFARLVSINPSHPHTVIAYLVGKRGSMFSIGDSVSVISYEYRQYAKPGKVIGYGGVRELPEILQKSTAIKAFGREVFIEIGAENNFSTGEKVLVK